MKIEVTERGSKDYYDEFLYVASKYSDFIKNPNRRVYRLTKYLYVLEALIVLFLILLMIFYHNFRDTIYLFLMGSIAFLSLFVALYILLVHKRIKTYMNASGKRIINMTKTGISYKDDNKTLTINWQDIERVLINKYSICFLPTDKNDIFITVSTDYQKWVLKGLKKFDKMHLIIENY